MAPAPKKKQVAPKATPAKKTSSVKDDNKAKSDAVKRAEKLGTVTDGPYLTSSRPFKSRPNDVMQTVENTITSKRGNKYNVTDSKVQRSFMRDDKPSVSVSPVVKPKSATKKTAASKAAPKKKK